MSIDYSENLIREPAEREQLLSVSPISEDEGVVEKKDDDSDQALFDAIAADAKLSEEESDKALDDIAAELGELMGDSSNDDTTNDLIGGEE